MMAGNRRQFAVLTALAMLGAIAAGPARSDELCVECIRVWVGPPTLVRGPFADEIDAPFSAIRLADGSFRGFSANGSTYAIHGSSPSDMGGPRRIVLEAGASGSKNECGRWLTSTARSGDRLLGMVHQEQICDYGPDGQTDKSMAIATSLDDGLNWTDLGTVITGRDVPQPGRITGEGDCTMVDGRDNYLYAYCLRNADWQTIVARAPLSAPLDWRKYHDDDWTEPGLGGEATAIGFLGPGAAYLRQWGQVAVVTPDPWFGGLRLSLSEDKISFVDLDAPLVGMDGSEWDRPADTELFAYATILNPDDGGSAVDDRFLLSYLYVPAGRGFDSRYLVHHEVQFTVEDRRAPIQAGIALTRWVDSTHNTFITSTGPLTGERRAYRRDEIVTYMLTRQPENGGAIKFAECSRNLSGYLDHILADEGSCEANGYSRERTAGWLYALPQPETLPVYRCLAEATGTHFVSNARDCEGLGRMEFLLGYGLTQ